MLSIYQEKREKCADFTRDRLGMFIHWGIYAIHADGEWWRSREEISDEEYNEYFKEFNPTRYEPEKWAKTAKNAGIKYAVITTKHHDGFCLFDSEYTDFKATNTPAKRDLIKEYVEAFRKEGIKIGFYYSLIDWNHKDYPHYKDPTHPARNDERFKDAVHNFSNYTEYMRNQVRELLTNYGKIDIMWFDFSYDDMTGEKWEAGKLISMIRELQPNIIIDNRLISDDVRRSAKYTDQTVPSYLGDFESPEQIIPTNPKLDYLGREVDWESCITLNNHWGYGARDKDYMSAKNVIHLLADAVSKGGNLLLNVGPNAKGEFPKEYFPIFETLGQWMYENGESIYGCGKADFPRPQWGVYTQNGNKLYAHIFERGVAQFRFDGLFGKVKKARLVSDGSELKLWGEWRKDSPGCEFVEFGTSLLPDDLDTVVMLELKETDNEQ